MILVWCSIIGGDKYGRAHAFHKDQLAPVREQRSLCGRVGRGPIAEDSQSECWQCFQRARRVRPPTVALDPLRKRYLEGKGRRRR